MRASRAAAGAVLAFATACAGPVAPPPTVAAPSGHPSPSPVVRPSPVPPFSAPPRSPLPLSSPLPRAPLTLRVALDPPTPKAGDVFTLSLRVTNDGDRAVRGVYVATSGPWDHYTVLSVRPRGAFGRDASGWYLVGGLALAPGESGTLDVQARADAPSDEELTFAVREADPGEMP